MMPFAGGIESVSNGTLLLSVAAAILYLLMVERSASIRRTIVKTAAVGLLGVLAIVENGPLLLVVALLLSAAGDAFLAHEGEKPFLGGLGSFLAAHLACVWLFLDRGTGPDLLIAEPWRAAVLALALLAGILLLRRLVPAVDAGLRVPVAVYVVAILAMMAAAAMIPAPVVVLGAALFVASDAILATGKFLLPANSPHRSWASPSVWVLYYLAQLLIALGFLL